MNTTENKPNLKPYIEAIRERFQPALKEEEATHRFTTAEVRAAVLELNPGISVTEAQVHDALTDAGFRFSSPRGQAGLRFLWLMIEVQ